MNCDKKCQCLSRREFLESSVKTLATITVVGSIPSIFYGCGQGPLDPGTGNSGGISSGGPVVLTPNNANNNYLFTFERFPQLQNAGGTLRALISATSGEKDVFVTRVSATDAKTVSTICTHAGCLLDAYDSTKKQYFCPCHASRFAADGAVLVGPATVPLSQYTSTITSIGIQVQVA